jgi:hypothetical protein
MRSARRISCRIAHHAGRPVPAAYVNVGVVIDLSRCMTSI